MGWPSIDQELMIRMLVVGYVRLICREVQVNLAYRWFCRFGIEDAIPDHSAFSRARNERFRGGMFFAACLSVSSRRALRPAWLVAKALRLTRALLRPMPTSSARSQVRIGAGIVIRRGQAAQ
jgi:hypothetical protein